MIVSVPAETPAETLNTLIEVALKLLPYDREAETVIMKVAKHPHLPCAKLEDFLKNPPCNDALWGALQNPQLSAAELDEWAKKPIALADDGIGSPTGWALASICRNPNTSAETLKAIAERDDFVSAVASAHLGNKWPDHLQALCDALEENTKTPPEVVYFITCLGAAAYAAEDEEANPLL